MTTWPAYSILNTTAPDEPEPISNSHSVFMPRTKPRPTKFKDESLSFFVRVFVTVTLFSCIKMLTNNSLLVKKIIILTIIAHIGGRYEKHSNQHEGKIHLN